MTNIAAAEIAARLGLEAGQVEKALALLDAGCSLAFIARYRKEQTGSLGEGRLRDVLDTRRRMQQLQARKQVVIDEIAQRDSVPEGVARAIRDSDDLAVVEDLAHALRPIRNSAGAKATERGLGPLSQAILQDAVEPPLEGAAADYVDHDHDVHTPDDALAGAMHIIAEAYSVTPAVREEARRAVRNEGVLTCSRGSVPEDRVKEFRDYFAYTESIRDVPPHRVLAVNRGERKKALKATIDVPLEPLLQRCAARVIAGGHRHEAFLRSCLSDAVKRLVLPAVIREVRREMTLAAEDHAMDVFANNVRGILMTPPVTGRRIMAIDPGFRTGCKVAVIDAAGELVRETIVYAHEPQCRWAEAKAALTSVIRDCGVQAIAIGNGTGCHETERLISEIIIEGGLDVEYALVSEAGASAYAASDLAAEEFPRLDPALRATVSVARRLRDPLSEFVKVDPRIIGVGLYQHDIDQQRLKARLDIVVEACINTVGVDVNAASAALLERVSGLSRETAARIIAYRRQAGPLTSREQLLAIEGIDDHVFQQCAGFLFVDGPNPLDRTRIHPERYALAEALVGRFGCSLEDLRSDDGLPGLRQKLEGLSLEALSREHDAGVPTLSHMLWCLEHPHHDPRGDNPAPIFKKQMMSLDDLRPGMWLKGSVRNVVDFGAFVDIGVEEDGLVHVSQFSRKYIKNPADFLHVGQTIDARVLSIDRDRRRIALSMIRETEAPASPPVAGSAPLTQRPGNGLTPPGASSSPTPPPQ